MTDSNNSTEEMRDILQEFVMDCKEMLEAIEPVLVELEDDYDEERINTVFRCFHSIKGGAGFLDLNQIQRITHSAETLLDLFRKGKIEFVSEHLDIMVSVGDQITKILEQVYEDGTDKGFETENEKLCLDIKTLIAGQHLDLNKTDERADNEAATEVSPAAEQPDGGQEMEVSITQEIIKQFVQEAEGGFEKLEEILLILEKCGFDQHLLDDAYRVVHSFKGNCGFLNFSDLERISHKVETVFEGMKNREIPIIEKNISVLVNVTDCIRSTIHQTIATGSANVPNCGVVLELMEDIIIRPTGKKTEKKVEVAKTEVTPKAEKAPVSLPVDSSDQDQQKNKVAKVSEEKSLSNKTLQSDIRVNLNKVDKVINLVGELMIVSQMITSHLQKDTDSNSRSARQLNSLITELQDVAMSIRMIPVAGTFRKMVRLVRDLSKKSGKQVQFETKGEDTELDKTVVEQISDPLVHLVRNAIDHGLELPAERIAVGKPETGRLVIEAKYEGNEVWINIIDDGKGLNREKILSKGIERKLVTLDEAKDWPDSKVFKLIFEPGFSTAEKITSVSGRGVGMDVVRRNVENVKGHVDIKSVAGQGSTIGIRIPLTLAIIDGMLLRVGSAIYTAPLLAIRESVQVDTSKVTMVDKREVVMIREQLIPVYRLHKLHNITPQFSKIEDGILIILEYQDEVFGLFVDELLGQYQTVIKGLSEYLGKIPGVSGCSILSNGEVSLILDVADLRKEIV